MGAPLPRVAEQSSSLPTRLPGRFHRSVNVGNARSLFYPNREGERRDGSEAIKHVELTVLIFSAIVGRCSSSSCSGFVGNFWPLEMYQRPVVINHYQLEISGCTTVDDAQWGSSREYVDSFGECKRRERVIQVNCRSLLILSSKMLPSGVRSDGSGTGEVKILNEGDNELSLMSRHV